jgi:hypothetical protein
MMGRSHRWETFPKCEAELGYILAHPRPLFGVAPTLSFTLHLRIFLLRQNSILETAFL